ncbi:uncharacterized protein LOC116350332 [Contarinia nasturtii]|uniref:uncharacterized protein LOC116350332 n=1 Tax=Contarinia nasturtii TaxID=265458 RepID=UPI0012D3B325|nr:uncharacterized protein LOC116350332 [Contarinia nasturtii]
MILTILGVLAVASILEANMAINFQYYCRPELDCMKKPAKSHVMCSYPTNWTSGCKSPRFIPLTDAHKKIFLDGHNVRRNIIALGKLPGIFAGRKAVDMAEIVWDDELEMIAQKNLITCEFEHDQCRRTKKYIWAGQNLAQRCKQPFLTPEEAMEWANEAWWNEYKDVTFIDKSNNYSSISASNQYGHFTQMARDKAYAMGCAVTSTEDEYCHTIACNYAVTNWGLDPVYATGPVRSKCKTFSKKYPGLCSDREDYTNYVRFGVSFFTKDSSPVPPLQQWIANGRVLISGTDVKRPSASVKRKTVKPTPVSSVPTMKRQKVMPTMTTTSVRGQVPRANSIETQMPRITTVKRSVPVTTRATTTTTTTTTTMRRPQVVSSKVSLGTFQMNNLNDMDSMMAEVKKRLGQNINTNTINTQLSRMNVQLGDGFNGIGNGNGKVRKIRISGNANQLPDWAKKHLQAAGV